jgi:hypothetical protein
LCFRLRLDKRCVEGGKKLVGHLFGRGVDHAAANLAQLAPHRGLHGVLQPVPPPRR